MDMSCQFKGDVIRFKINFQEYYDSPRSIGLC